MARIVGGIGCSHAPSIAHSYDKKLQKDPMWAPLHGDVWEPATLQGSAAERKS